MSQTVLPSNYFEHKDCTQSSKKQAADSAADKVKFGIVVGVLSCVCEQTKCS